MLRTAFGVLLDQSGLSCPGRSGQDKLWSGSCDRASRDMQGLFSLPVQRLDGPGQTGVALPLGLLTAERSSTLS